MIRTWDLTHALPSGAFAMQVGFRGGPMINPGSSTPLLPLSGTGTR